MTDPIDRIPPAPPPWALRERDARRDGDPRRPKDPPRKPADEPEDDEPHLSTCARRARLEPRSRAGVARNCESLQFAKDGRAAADDG